MDVMWKLISSIQVELKKIDKKLTHLEENKGIRVTRIVEPPTKLTASNISMFNKEYMPSLPTISLDATHKIEVAKEVDFYADQVLEASQIKQNFRRITHEIIIKPPRQNKEFRAQVKKRKYMSYMHIKAHQEPLG